MPSPAQTPSLTPAPGGPVAPSPAPAEWTAEVAAGGAFWTPRIAIDGRGAAHIVAVHDGLLVYLTNADGSWQRRPVAAEPARDFELAIDDDDSVWIAYSMDGRIEYTTNASGEWAAPATVVEGSVEGVSLEVSEGRIHLAYLSHELEPGTDGILGSEVHYLTDESGTWNDRVVDVDASAPILGLGPDLSVHVLYRPETGDDVRYVVADSPTGEFLAPETPSLGFVHVSDFAVDRAGQAHLSWIGDNSSVHYAVYTDGWSAPENASGGWDAPVGYHQLAVDHDGRAHIAMSFVQLQGTAYATNAGGEFVALPLGDQGLSVDAAIALDRDGRAHFVVTNGELDTVDDQPMPRNLRLVYLTATDG